MPADPRRSTRRTLDDDLAVRRSRGEISCAECRRLKVKCDKKIPCGSCVRRGCHSICPTGALSTGQGTRFVLADTTQLHAKLSEMGERIRQLEDALATFQSGVSSDCHPLLTNELLAIKFGSEQAEANHPTEDLLQTVDALGTLTIGEDGEAKYFGRSAGSEAAAESEPLNPADAHTDLNRELVKLSNAFPFSDISLEPDNFLPLVSPYFPNRLRAWSLCELYTEHLGWSFNPILRNELVDDYLTPIYNALEKPPFSLGALVPTLTPHRCAVLFAIFALAAWMDLTADDYAATASQYYHLCRACISMRSVFDSPEIATVQAVSLMSIYHGLDGTKFTMDSSWTLLSLASKLAQSLGLHRDGAQWNMDPKAVTRRRHLFWELYSQEVLYCMGLGRPPSIRLSYIDTEIPDDGEYMDDQGNKMMGFYQWKHGYMKHLFSETLETLLAANPPRYEAVLALDRKIREKPIPSHLSSPVNGFNGAEDLSIKEYFRRALLEVQRVILLLYIHRSFFAQALLDQPLNPLRSPYAPSFVAAYRCALTLMKHMLNGLQRFPDFVYRIWQPWTHLFSAAMIFGSIATHAPTISLAHNSRTELQIACGLFEVACSRSSSRRLSSAARVLFNLRDKALEVSSHESHPPTPSQDVYGRNASNQENDLAIFGGQGRTFRSKHISSRPQPPEPKPDQNRSITRPLDLSSTASNPTNQEPQEALLAAQYLDILRSQPHMSPETSSSLFSVPSSSTTGMEWTLPDIDSFPPSDVVNPGPYWPNFDPSPFQKPTDTTGLNDMDSSVGGTQALPSSSLDAQWQAFMRDSIAHNPLP